MAQPSPPPAYVVVELAVRDLRAIRRYAREVPSVMARYGGQILATSAQAGRVVEGEERPTLLAVHRWRSQEDFDAFFASAEYAPLRRLRRDACETRIAIFDAAPAPTLLPWLQGEQDEPPLAEEARFLSPAAEHRGRREVRRVLRALAAVLDDVAVASVADDGLWRTTALTGRIGDRAVQGILRERCDAHAEIDEAELYLRPYAVLREGIARMRTLLARDPLAGEAGA